MTGGPDWAAADSANETVSESILGSLTALSAFRSEIGSLLLMVAMLFGISGLVIGAFFTVWTMQRKGDIAMLKADDRRHRHVHLVHSGRRKCAAHALHSG